MDSSASKRKRLSTIDSSINDHQSFITDKQFECPICLELLEDPHVTKCGHTFCYRCVMLSLESSSLCPKCGAPVDQIYPNHLICELVLKRRKKNVQESELGVQSSELARLREMLDERSERLDIGELNVLIETLARKRRRFQDTSKLMQCELLHEFLVKVQRHKRDQMLDLAKEVTLVEQDTQKAEQALEAKYASHSSVDRPGYLISMMGKSESGPSLRDDFGKETFDWSTLEKKMQKLQRDFGIINQDGGDRTGAGDVGCNEGSNLVGSGGSTVDNSSNGNELTSAPTPGPSTSTSALLINTADDCLKSPAYQLRRKKMMNNFDDLEQFYFSTRLRESELPAPNENDFYESLDEFKETLNQFTMYSRLRPIASLSYTSDPFNGSSIVSSIEFDRDNELFAIASVTKKIKLFDYKTLIRDEVGIVHYPVNELICNSKISCISWSSYYKSMLASSDYDGTVTIWDPFANQRVKQFYEHDKRCWSVDFNKVDTKLLGSGSDDWKVKLWSVNMAHSITSLEASANVCCVKFSPTSRYHLAFGSADHYVHYYDLRNSKSPLMVFKGHKKAVSYVSFLNSNEIVSASTDSQLKLWNTNKPACQRSFRGHINEKNFVGLASDGNFVACGSENNSIYVYYKGFSRPAVAYSFDSKDRERERREDEASEFLSAVCWKPKSNVVVAANSQGTIKVLELV